MMDTVVTEFLEPYVNKELKDNKEYVYLVKKPNILKKG